MAVVFVLGFVSGMMSACAGVRPVTVGGVPTVNEVTQEAANRIYNAETAFLLAGESLLVLREAGEIDDARWVQIADASDKATTAILEARDALLEYERLKNDESATKLNKALSVVDFLGRRLLAYTVEE